MKREQQGLDWASAQAILRCKWTALVLERLAEGITRPAHLRRAIAGLSAKVLYERLRELQKSGFVMVQTFAGYPRRTEYRLTSSGWQLARLVSVCHRQGVSVPVLAEVLKCRWLPEILTLLRTGPHRPSQLQRQLSGISTKVLSEKLEKLERLHLIVRQVSATRPVAVWYRVSDEGERLCAVLAGMERAPEPSESLVGVISHRL